jgi:hypothetical protein
MHYKLEISSLGSVYELVCENVWIVIRHSYHCKHNGESYH